MPFRFLAIALVFFCSGLTGLLYQVAFSKLLSYVFGATAYSVSAVLAAFMAGLAGGSALGGRFARDVRRPFAAYGVVEIIIGVVCALAMPVFGSLQSVYAALAPHLGDSLLLLTGARWSLALLLVAIPTMAMGATLPILTKALQTAHIGERGVPILYALNTFGGAFGALTSAYVVLPLLGIKGAVHLAAVGNVALGLVAIGLGRATSEGAPQSAASHAALRDEDVSPRETSASSPPASMMALAVGSGMLVFIAEVVCTHLLALLVGSSTYAFAIMLATFLGCLGIGAALAPPLHLRFGPNALPVSLLAAAAGLCVSMPVWDQLPRIFPWVGQMTSSWALREAARAGTAALALAPAAIPMGLTFPLLLARVGNHTQAPRWVGRLGLASTVGSVMGAILGGYLVLPTLGSQGSLRLIIVCYAIAARIPFASPVGRRVRATSLAFATFGLLWPTWDTIRMTNGANVYFSAGPPPDALHFMAEDVHGGVTTVVSRGDVLTMYTNGKFQGDNGAEMAAQRRFAHYPSLYVRNFDRALVVGLGTGVTLGAVAAYPWKHIDVAEISPAIVESSRRFFEKESRFALSDPRVRLHMNDGRNILFLSAQTYDLITIELTSVWFAGASSLYSREFYQLVASRLGAAGILQQWIQLHHIHPREVASIIKTLQHVFPHVALFEGGGQGILVASQAELSIAPNQLAQLGSLPSIQESLGGRSLSSLTDDVLLDDAGVGRFLAATPAIESTDDNLYLEFSTPKGNVLDYHASLREMLATLRAYR